MSSWKVTEHTNHRNSFDMYSFTTDEKRLFSVMCTLNLSCTKIRRRVNDGNVIRTKKRTFKLYRPTTEIQLLAFTQSDCRQNIAENKMNKFSFDLFVLILSFGFLFIFYFISVSSALCVCELCCASFKLHIRLCGTHNSDVFSDARPACTRMPHTAFNIHRVRTHPNIMFFC